MAIVVMGSALGLSGFHRPGGYAIVIMGRDTRSDDNGLYKQLESSEKQIFEACAPFGAGISAGSEDVLRGCRSTDSK